MADPPPEGHTMAEYWAIRERMRLRRSGTAARIAADMNANMTPQGPYGPSASTYTAPPTANTANTGWTPGYGSLVPPPANNGVPAGYGHLAPPPANTGVPAGYGHHAPPPANPGITAGYGHQAPPNANIGVPVGYGSHGLRPANTGLRPDYGQLAQPTADTGVTAGYGSLAPVGLSGSVHAPPNASRFMDGNTPASDEQVPSSTTSAPASKWLETPLPKFSVPAARPPPSTGSAPPSKWLETPPPKFGVAAGANTAEPQPQAATPSTAKAPATATAQPKLAYSSALQGTSSIKKDNISMHAVREALPGIPAALRRTTPRIDPYAHANASHTRTGTGQSARLDTMPRSDFDDTEKKPAPTELPATKLATSGRNKGRGSRVADRENREAREVAEANVAKAGLTMAAADRALMAAIKAERTASENHDAILAATTGAYTHAQTVAWEKTADAEKATSDAVKAIGVTKEAYDQAQRDLRNVRDGVGGCS